MSKTHRRKKSEPAESAPKPRRPYTQNRTALDGGIPCPWCRHRHDHAITNTYHNGNRRRICGSCGKPFVTLRAHEEDCQNL